MTQLVWQAAGVLAQATPSPSPTPGLREGLDESAISPGLAGFLAVFGIALATVALFYSLTGKLRKVRSRDGGAPVVAGAMAGAGVVPVSDVPQPADGGTEQPADGDLTPPTADGAAPAEPDEK